MALLLGAQRAARACHSDGSENVGAGEGGGDASLYAYAAPLPQLQYDVVAVTAAAAGPSASAPAATYREPLLEHVALNSGDTDPSGFR